MSIKCSFDWEDTGHYAKWDNDTGEVLTTTFPCQFKDDFDGPDLVIPAAAESGCKWRKTIVNSATVAKSANTSNGEIACVLDSTEEAQTGAIYQGDQKTWSVEQGLILETRIKVFVTPTLVAEAVFGLTANTGVPDSIGESIFFTVDGSTSIFCEKDDGSTDQTVDSDLTALTTQWKIYRIDCTNTANIKFFIDNVQVATGTTFGFAATGASAILQPWLGLYKASGAGVGTILIDYVKLFQNRS